MSKPTDLPGYRRILRYAALLILVISLPFMLKIIKTSSSTSQTIELKGILEIINDLETRRNYD